MVVETAGTGRGLNVLIVDDSAVVRQVMSELLQADKAIASVSSVADPIFAMRRMEKDWPDVIVLDIEMPRMDGLTFLKQIMQQRPTPVIICSTLAEQGADVTMKAMSLGAFGVITKPKMGLKGFLLDSANDVVSVVKAAASARLKNIVRTVSKPPSVKPSLAANSSLPRHHKRNIVAIGTSTGGTQALERILVALPVDVPGIVIVQHMPEKFTAMFAQRLNSLCQIEVKEAEDRDLVLPGRALIAPGGRHMQLARINGRYAVNVIDGPLVNRHKPAVDVLFRSVAKIAAKDAAGYILTGMGDDGARGLLEMRQAGAETIAQDEASCVVFGMPKEAIELDAASRIIALDDVARDITEL
ncbi:chemotaxis response regulator protein-glutamate methylesterase [Shewanella sp. C32]|uniref:Protein-glutamate methylesterase/protein-glutamine glutaminase n=1 Tax=Shewanella electrica TaxID=515560 RepID=A0ABT2FI09_9GAMM|nr:chemotaxis response regulator protein-glutamate methylesterase [Shewanella electrica]MCH1924067.1 chemotaxis response regulator protein-glutamate methylesterase [Shewanella electrica]MCS4555970.1 chemotaxis response regulator protein-glutamate methylesterase [Shewanella electrica]